MYHLFKVGFTSASGCFRYKLKQRIHTAVIVLLIFKGLLRQKTGSRAPLLLVFTQTKYISLCLKMTALGPKVKIVLLTLIVSITLISMLVSLLFCYFNNEHTD